MTGMEMRQGACVFCAAGHPAVKDLDREVQSFAMGLFQRNMRLVYGGGSAGLMGQFADEALARGCEVQGAITEKLNFEYEVGHKGLNHLEIVADLFDRKRWFFDHSDVFFVYPGGIGTLDEALEVLTWSGLGECDKPLVFVNLEGFWDSFRALLSDLQARNVIRSDYARNLHFVTSSSEAWSLWDSLKKGPRD